MPDLVDIEEVERPRGSITTPKHVESFSRFLAGKTKQHDGARVMPILRQFFREHADERKTLRRWYIALPAEDGEPKKKEKKK